MHQVPENSPPPPTTVNLSMTSYLSFNFTVSCLHSRSSNTQVELFFSVYTGFTARFPVIFSNSLNVLLMRWVGVNSAPRSTRLRDALACDGDANVFWRCATLNCRFKFPKKKSGKITGSSQTLSVWHGRPVYHPPRASHAGL